MNPTVVRLRISYPGEGGWLKSSPRYQIFMVLIIEVSIEISGYEPDGSQAQDFISGRRWSVQIKPRYQT